MLTPGLVPAALARVPRVSDPGPLGTAAGVSKAVGTTDQSSVLQSPGQKESRSWSDPSFRGSCSKISEARYFAPTVPSVTHGPGAAFAGP